ncbi:MULTISPECIES: Rmf/CrpP fold protein [unclassified Streptomyces]|uniref:Rmf/CrpP fold protein n=1 Tax=unclassified Streptomyces TaxID=2593676 RepID=UPI002D21A561|nr:Rmf/CrpP fold protein [Streptomyces sp. BoleA5]
MRGTTRPTSRTRGDGVGTRTDIAEAIRKGEEAGRTGQRPNVCPYPGTSLLRTAWIKGYASTAPRPSATT